MGTKTISITDEAYTLLKNAKDDKESFTDVIIKSVKKDPLSKLVGILKPEEAENMRRHIKATRKRMNERVKKTALRLQ
ncbi:antitoxin VapB family protein [Candidatus Woesearchaeota archaeon]|nr:antitoxin VapB family protein [Candidatus Woesearchaeota archaeon]